MASILLACQWTPKSITRWTPQKQHLHTVIAFKLRGDSVHEVTKDSHMNDPTQ